jgi:hypothetical protein
VRANRRQSDRWRPHEISKNHNFGQEPDIAQMLSSKEGRQNWRAVCARVAADGPSQGNAEHREELMTSMRSDRARGRARDLLVSIAPLPEDAEFYRLRELAIDYIKEAERLEAENRGRAAESAELISAALDAVARDYFERALACDRLGQSLSQRRNRCSKP